MRKSDKTKKLNQANLLAEQRYLNSKGFTHEAFVDSTGNVQGLTGDATGDDLEDFLDQFDTSSGMMNLKDLEATRNKGYQRNPQAAQIADFANQYQKRLKVLYQAYTSTGKQKISYSDFVRKVFNGHAELVTSPIQAKINPQGSRVKTVGRDSRESPLSDVPPDFNMNESK